MSSTFIAMSLRRTLSALLLMSLPGCGAAPATTATRTSPAASSERISAAEIDAHLRFLSHDLLEGRAPATRGGQLTAEYIAAQFRVFGLEPGNGDSYFQEVPTEIVSPDRASIRVTTSGRSSAPLRYSDDVMFGAGSARENISAGGELVFVGYGASAPEYNWDDYKGQDLRGKVLLVLVNDPPAIEAEPNLFGGRAMTYYGRWTYKFEEAERRGAVGALVVHTTEDAGYGWATVQGSFGERRMLPRDPQLPPPLAFQGWITNDAAARLLADAGLDMAQLRRQAQTREFRPVATGINLNVAFRSEVRRLTSPNVIGVVRGAEPALRDEYIVYTAHWDHLGIGPAVKGDSIYNGAEDNASGTAAVLAIARAAAAGPRPQRSMMFTLVTLEESGLLGSAYFGENPPVPARNIIAGINIDVANLRGETRDFRVIGSDRSTLGPMLERTLAPRGWRITPDAYPERGYFFRSDHFSLAKAGIPVVWLSAGNDFVGRPSSYAPEMEEEYRLRRYHQPADEYRTDFDLAGAVQIAQLGLDFGLWLANSREYPQWNPDAEFQRPGN